MRPEFDCLGEICDGARIVTLLIACSAALEELLRAARRLRRGGGCKEENQKEAGGETIKVHRRTSLDLDGASPGAAAMHAQRPLGRRFLQVDLPFIVSSSASINARCPQIATVAPQSASSNKAPELYSILLYDPQTRTSTMLNAQEKTFRTTTVNQPPATVPPGLLDATPVGNMLQQNEFTTKEDLGFQTVGGVPAHGVRETQKISSDSAGAEKEVTIVDEYWYSDDLRINVLISHSDPRTGHVTLAVTQIQRAEPDPALFEIPSGYRRAGNQQ